MKQLHITATVLKGGVLAGLFVRAVKNGDRERLGFQRISKRAPEKHAIFGEEFVKGGKFLGAHPNLYNTIYGKNRHIYAIYPIYGGKNKCSPILGIFLLCTPRDIIGGW